MAATATRGAVRFPRRVAELLRAGLDLRDRHAAGARAQSVLMSVGRTCWQQARSAVDFLSQLLRGMPAALALPP